MATEPQRSETTATASSSSEPAGWPAEKSDVGADAALILAALGRLATAVRDERALLAKLRDALGDMARAIATAKAVADSETAAALLDEFEHRVDAMIEIAGGRARASTPVEPVTTNPSSAAEPMTVESAATTAQPIETEAAEPEQVPTVSRVIAPQGQTETPPTEPRHAPEMSDDAVPTVAMLTAMVEALRDSIPADPEPPTAAAQPAPEPAVADAAEPAAVAFTMPEPHNEIGLAEQPSEIVLTEPVADVTAAEPVAVEAWTVETVVLALPEVEAAAPAADEPITFVTTAAMLPPVEVFATVPPPTPPVLDAAPAAPEPAEAAAPVTAELVTPPVPASEPPSAAPSEQALMQESRLLASMAQIGTRPFAPPEEGAAVIFSVPSIAAEAAVPKEPDAPPASETLTPTIDAVEPGPAEAPVRTALPETLFVREEPRVVEEPPPPEEPPVVEAALPAEAPPVAGEPAIESGGEFDPSDFLFGPEPEPDPAAFLLEPSPAETAAPSPTREPVAQVASEPEQQPEEATPPPHDPLQALKAMSPEERLAVFS